MTWIWEQKKATISHISDVRHCFSEKSLEDPGIYWWYQWSQIDSRNFSWNCWNLPLEFSAFLIWAFGKKVVKIFHQQNSLPVVGPFNFCFLVYLRNNRFCRYIGIAIMISDKVELFRSEFRSNHNGLKDLNPNICSLNAPLRFTKANQFITLATRRSRLIFTPKQGQIIKLRF